jgi:hypothetical protein
VGSYQTVNAAYSSLLSVTDALDDVMGWQTSRCGGWTVRDLMHHLLTDAQRALVALHTPAAGPADVDAVSYWKSWQPDTPDADADRRDTRIMASTWPSVRPIAEQYAETATAVLVAAQERSGDELVATQGHVLAVDALLSTLAVEATVHQLDMSLGQPSEAGLAETCRVLDGLLGRLAPIPDPVRYVLVCTGREPGTAAERSALGTDADRLPLFG